MENCYEKHNNLSAIFGLDFFKRQSLSPKNYSNISTSNLNIKKKIKMVINTFYNYSSLSYFPKTELLLFICSSILMILFIILFKHITSLGSINSILSIRQYYTFTFSIFYYKHYAFSQCLLHVCIILICSQLFYTPNIAYTDYFFNEYNSLNSLKRGIYSVVSLDRVFSLAPTPQEIRFGYSPNAQTLF